jgi:DNA-binding IclR family transcriptional regulator
MAIMAPVYDGHNRVVMALVMAGFHGGMTGNAVVRAGARLAETCERISGYLSGKPFDD